MGLGKKDLSREAASWLTRSQALPSMFMPWKKTSLTQIASTEPDAHDLFLDAIQRNVHTVSGAGRTQEERRILSQELSFEAGECVHSSDAISLSLRAVRLNPAQLDARVLLAFAAGGPSDELIQELEQIVRIGEQELGPECFRENRGRFWLVTDTRPYTRAYRLGAGVASGRASG